MKILRTFALAGIVGAALASQSIPASADTYADIIAAKKIRIATDLAIPHPACSTPI